MATLVVLNFFPAFTPPSSGGEMRVGSLYRALSKDYDVVLLTSTDFGARFEEILHTPRLRELRFPKDDLWRASYSTLERSGIQGDLAGLAFALAVSDPSCDLRIQARQLATNASAVIHEFPFSEPIFADGCSCRELYNSHNFETSLLSSIVRGPGFEDSLLKLMRLEGNLVRRAERVFATSESDAEKFRLFYGASPSKLALCPNGFDNEELSPIAEKRQKRIREATRKTQLLFIGSAHHPNVEAAHFLLQLAPELPECEFLLAGGLCAALTGLPIPTNLTLIGPVNLSTKLNLLRDVDVFLNPVVLGSGTSLKALEALGSGVPMVSTPEGVRGLGLIPDVHCEIVVRSEFIDAIRRLANDRKHCERLVAAARSKASEEFSWDRIAAQLSSYISGPTPSKLDPAQPLILALNDYPVLQPGSGGIARVRNLLTNLNSDVVLVSFGPTCEIALISTNVVHVTVQKTAAHIAFEKAINEEQPVSVNDSVASLFVASNRVLVDVVSALAQRASAVVFEHPYMAPILDAIDIVRPDLPIIYSAHNVEATHKAQLLSTHCIGSTLTAFIAELERRLTIRASLVVCCTDADVSYFQNARVASILVPNGCTIPPENELDRHRSGSKSKSQPRLGFLGSSHGPNVEAAEYIVTQLAPAFPDFQFEFVGSVCSAVPIRGNCNVVMHGIVSESEKTSLLTQWDIALNPIESGGGSSLKLPDYMSHGLVTLNTAAGARGFAVEENDTGIVINRSEFPDALVRMLEDSVSHRQQSINARRYAVEQLGWTPITNQYRTFIRSLFRSPPASNAPRMLVVTYRYTEPSLGGAEEYLIEVLKRLRPRFSTIDLAAIDVDHITNHHHFGCTLSTPKGGAARRIGSLFDVARYFAPDVLDEEQVVARSRDLERAWSREERELLSLFAAHLAGTQKLRLFGGFFGPENHDGVVRRWTSPTFSFLLPTRACSFQMTGYASAEKQLRMTLVLVHESGQTETIASYQQLIPIHFSVCLSLPANASEGQHLLLSCEVDEHQAVGDHRPFGVLVDSAIVLIDPAGALRDTNHGIFRLDVSTADLNEQIDEQLRFEQFEEWLSALRKIASQRDATAEENFARVRGPHSGALREWLVKHAENYDTVWVQGIPFDVIPSTVEIVNGSLPRPRIVTLPHFHGDDRFYHWQRYYRSFALADSTMLFSASIAKRLNGDTHFDIVPGGGVRADEHGDPAAIPAFNAIYRGGKPFFLCLGRKTASKGYEQAIRAHQTLRRSGVDVELVLIGPDEDGREVNGEGLHYLGRQPREVIRGALSSCIGLITMSRSESFGIVLCEAWLFGKPVIANKSCYSFRELVQHGVTGLLVNTEQELAESMRRLFSNAREQQAMGRAGFQNALDKLTWENVANSCYQILANSQSITNLAHDQPLEDNPTTATPELRNSAEVYERTTNMGRATI